jgi:anaerobic selenocysteine-containing dehydrogenase
VDYQPSPEVPDDEYPMLLTTGRTLYQFHTRTKTGRAPQLNQAAPEVWVELNPQDADRLGIAEGDLVGIASPRGAVQARACLCGVRPGVVFLPFRHGWFDQDPHDRTPRSRERTHRYRLGPDLQTAHLHGRRRGDPNP